MSIRSCETRPIAWKINSSLALAEAVKKEGFEVWPMFIGLLTSRDNLGFCYGSLGILKDFFYPHHEISLEKVSDIRQALIDVGLIIHYVSKSMDFILIPKVGNFSDIVGNMSDKTKCLLPEGKEIQEWEKRFNDVYTPPERRLYAVQPEGKGKGQIEGKGKIEIEGKGKRIKTVLPQKKYISKVESFFKTIDQKWITELKETYKNKDITFELKKMQSWLKNNPNKQRSNFKSFAVNWLNREVGNERSTIFNGAKEDRRKELEGVPFAVIGSEK